MSNPIEKPLQNCFERLNTLNGALHMIKSQSDIALSRLKSHVSDKAQERLLYGSRLLLEDIGNIPSDLWRQFHPTNYVFVVRGKDLEQAFADIIEHMNLLIVSQGYETFETFLFDSVAYLHYAQPATANSKKLEKWVNKGNSYPSTLEDWSQYVRAKYRGKNDRDLLSWIRRLASHVSEVEKQNTLRMDLREWFAAVSEVRHAATHSKGLIKREKGNSLSTVGQAILRSQFPGMESTNGYDLHLDTKSSGRALEVFQDYAYAIHKSLSIEYDQVPAYTSKISQ